MKVRYYSHNECVRRRTIYGIILYGNLEEEHSMQIEKIRGHQTDQLFKAVLELKDIEECYKFFDDLCTISEIQSLAQRFEVAHLLRLKKTYETIKKETGASTATISRVRRCFDYGNDTYDEMLGRLYPEEKPFQPGKGTK